MLRMPRAQMSRIMIANEDSIRRHFERIGARFRTRLQIGNHYLRVAGYAFDVARDKQGEFIELVIRQGHPISEMPRITLLQAEPRQRHLLLLVNGRERLLCGHDERHWFVASVPHQVSTVVLAKESLKPAAVLQAQQQAALSFIERNRRTNRAFIRQGEWFFIPAEELKADPRLILRKEPIRRGRSKPHIVGELYRTGGETVFVSSAYPNGLTQREYSELTLQDPRRRHLHWRMMTRNAVVYARGTVSHPDHKTVILRGWHQVVLNNENPTSRAVAFLD